MISIFKRKPRYELHLALIHPKKKDRMPIKAKDILEAKRATKEIIQRCIEEQGTTLHDVLKGSSYIKDTKDNAKYWVRTNPNGKTVHLCRYW